MHISVRPKYADKIFDGSKTIELRRTRPSITSGDKLFVYTTSPVMELTGCCLVVKVISCTPEKLWEQAKKYAYIKEKDYWDYFHNCDTAYAIVLEKRIIQLQKLRGGLRPRDIQ